MTTDSKQAVPKAASEHLDTEPTRPAARQNIAPAINPPGRLAVGAQSTEPPPVAIAIFVYEKHSKRASPVKFAIGPLPSRADRRTSEPWDLLDIDQYWARQSSFGTS